ncbi:MAG: SDR family oxidoreductase [Candidatus Omnitrophica bacterium]|nr:SDR family oxidoreductase [Candidatus Omnitrophota bacterium]
MNKEAILITGASSDIGCEIIRQIAGNNSIILAHYNQSGEKIKKMQQEVDSQIIPIKADLFNEEEILGLIDFIKKNYDFPDKIIHLPAVKLNYIRFKDIKWADFQKDIDLQLRSIILILKEFLPLMAKDKKGKVVFVLSSCTLNIPPKALTHYTAVKYAMLGLSRALASEYADTGININAVSPSMIETGFLANIPQKLVELNAQASPLKRNAQVGDVVPLIKFLLSDSSDYITGANIPVSGGSVF